MGLWEMIKGEQPGFIEQHKNFENLGQWGEYVTEFAINKKIKGKYVVLKNIYIPHEGKTTEIDLIMVHEKGIFVFESKNYSGTIYGEIDQLNWIQVLDNGSKNKFYNPIRQNQTHIKALAKYLDLPEEDFLSYVIFSERCTLKKVPPKTPQVVVLRRPEMLERLQLQIAYNKRKYDDEAFGKIISKLREGTNKSEEEKQKHIEDIKTKCPFCGNELILRKGKYGEFWGCSAYPKCKFTRQNK